MNINSTLSNTLLSSTSGDDSIYNEGTNVTIDTGAGNDYVNNSGKHCAINTSAGKDSIANWSSYVTIDCGKGNDQIHNIGNDVSINGGAGDDFISNLGSFSSISGDEGNDSITSHDWHVILSGGTGNDSIYLGDDAKNNLVKYSSGDGNDTVVGFNNDDTLSISGSSYTTQASGYDVLVKVGAEAITLKNAYATADKIHINKKAIDLARKTIKLTAADNIYIFRESLSVVGSAGNDYVYNIGGSVTISGGKGNDKIYNEGLSVAIAGGEGDDDIDNRYTESVTIDGGTGNDSISNITGNTSIYGGEGNDFINNRQGSSVKIDGGDGNDLIYTNDVRSVAIFENSIGTDGFSYVTIAGDTGNDSIINYYSKVTISGGEGNDIIYNKWNLEKNTLYNGDGGSNVLFKYSSGDGNDKLYGFMADSTLSIAGSSYSTKKSGSNIIVTVGEGKITLVGAASLSAINIVGDETVAEKNKWTLNGTTATYGTSSKILATVSGVKSLDGISLSGKVVTVGASSLNQKKVTISDGYTLKLADGVPTSKPTDANWTHDGTKATYKSSGTTAGYTLANNSITYSKAKAASTLATINGIKSNVKPTVKGKVITLTKANLSGNKVTVSGSYGFNFANGDYKNTSITGSKNKDSITSSGSNLSIKGGKGNDFISLSSAAKNNVIVYNSGDGSDTISGFDENDTLKIAKGTAATSTSGNDVIFTVGKGKITVKGAADKTFSYTDESGTKTYSTVPASSEPYTIKGAGITLLSSYAEKEFDITTVNGGDDIVTINASAVKKAIKITGNENANYIIGSKGADTIDGYEGNDTLTGGDGADIFLHYNGDGNDVITDYKAEDIIKIGSDSAVKASTKNRDVILTVGKEKITVKNAVRDEIGVTYFENGIEHDYKDGEQTVSINEKKTTAVITKNYWKDSFDAVNFGENIHSIDGSEVTHNLKITGNDKANIILGGSGKNTFIGGTGNDTFQGGDKADVFLYSKGDGNDVIYGYATEDIISIKSGTVDNVSVKGDTVIFTVGKGKISLDGAVKTNVTYYDENGRTSKIYSREKSNDADSMWFLGEDDFSTGNELDAIIQSDAADYSFLNGSESLAEDKNLVVYGGKKIGLRRKIF
ncbi:MAG: hypothetical protein IKT98_11095 [Selenomonadaceae bacterium]|nr:hypothetical protein [Selenomonadaceae bacterium]